MFFLFSADYFSLTSNGGTGTTHAPGYPVNVNVKINVYQT